MPRADLLRALPGPACSRPLLCLGHAVARASSSAVALVGPPALLAQQGFGGGLGGGRAGRACHRGGEAFPPSPYALSVGVPPGPSQAEGPQLRAGPLLLFLNKTKFIARIRARHT